MADDSAPLTPLGKVGGELTLTHTSVLRRTWELTSADQLVAQLGDHFSGQATGQLAGGSYLLSRMDRHGSFGVTTAAGDSVAAFEREPWQPPGKLPADRYHIIWIGATPDEFRVSHGNTALVSVTQTGTFSEKHATVAITDAGRQDPHLDVLVLLACHAYSSADDIGAQNWRGFLGAGTFTEPEPEPDRGP